MEDARELFLLCRDGIIDKTRHMVPYEGKIFEVDEFHGENSGLVVAEIELGSEDEAFSRPPWLGKEVTGDRRYYSSQPIPIQAGCRNSTEFRYRQLPAGQYGIRYPATAKAGNYPILSGIPFHEEGNGASMSSPLS